MRSSLLLALRAHRKQSRRLVDYDDRIIQMDDAEADALERRVAHRLPSRNSHYIARLQLSIVPDIVRDWRLALHRHRPKPEQVLGLLAR